MCREGEEYRGHYDAVESFLCPREKRKVNEPENQRFVFVLFLSCYPNWFLDFLHFYVTLPLGHLMQITATQPHL